MKPYLYNLITIFGLLVISPVLYLVAKNGVHDNLGVSITFVLGSVGIFIANQIFQAYIELRCFSQAVTNARILALGIMLLLASFVPIFHFFLNPNGLGFLFIPYFFVNVVGAPIVLFLCLTKSSFGLAGGRLNPAINSLVSCVLNFIYIAALD